MAMTTQELRDARDELLRQLGSGVAAVTIDGVATTYRGQADIERAIAYIDRRIAGASNRPRVAYGRHRGGR